MSPLDYQPAPRPPRRNTDWRISAAGACGMISILFAVFAFAARFLPGVMKPWAPFAGAALAIVGLCLTLAEAQSRTGSAKNADRLTLGLNVVALTLSALTMGSGIVVTR